MYNNLHICKLFRFFNAFSLNFASCLCYSSISTFIYSANSHYFYFIGAISGLTSVSLGNINVLSDILSPLNYHYGT